MATECLLCKAGVVHDTCQETTCGPRLVSLWLTPYTLGLSVLGFAAAIWLGWPQP